MSHNNEKIAAVVLAAGQGKRMKQSVQKQYLMLRDKPVLYYALKAFEKSIVDEIVLVTGETEIDYCKREIVDKYGFQKVKYIVAGGTERYHSVFYGLKAVKDADLVLIHDGARPFVDDAIINRTAEGARKHDACVAGMPSKDTVKIADTLGFAETTPNRDYVWLIQTPQAFSYSLILDAYKKLLERDENAEQLNITDDAMVLECMTGHAVKLVEGSYRNIKITTPEDLKVAYILCEEGL